MLNAAVGAIDPGYEVNDLGFQIWADQINAHLMVGRRWTRPSRLFQSAQLNLATFRTWDFGGDLTLAGYFLMGTFDLRNFSHLQWTLEYDAPEPERPPHAGRAAEPEPAGCRLVRELHVGPDDRSGSPASSAQGDEFARDRQHSWSIFPTLEWHPSTRALDPVRPEPRQAAHHRAVRRHVRRCRPRPRPTGIATSSRSCEELQLSASVRLNWIFTPQTEPRDLRAAAALLGCVHQLQGAGRRRAPTTSSRTGPARTAPDDDTRLVVAPATPGLAQLEFDNPNFSLASLRGNAVLRWEYRPGSTIFFVWTQNRSDTITDGTFRVGDGLDRLFSGAANNVFLVKFSYWWRP